jgi:hypothetical protein
LGPEALPADAALPTDRGRTLDLDLVNQVSAKSLDAHDKLIVGVGKNVKTRAAALTQCAAGTAPEACAKQYAARLAERAFRRPVSEEELTDLMVAYQAGAAISPDDGIATLTEAILFAPSAMYRRELGTPNGAVATLTSWEMADQLSHLLYSSVPDEGLVSAAKADTLTSDDGIRRELERLLPTDRVKKSLSQTMLAWLQTGKLAQVTKDAKYPDFGALQESMYTETTMFIDDFLWGAQPGSIGELLTSTRSFVDPGLAKFYGVTYPGAQGSTAFMPVNLPATERAGILTQASLLSIKAGPDNTSVIFRGLFLHDKVLCLPEVPAPQDEATLMKIAQQEMGVETEMEKAMYRKETSPCKGCHAQFDPFGLALEVYDGIGRYRKTDEAGTPIDPTADLSAFSDQGLQGKVGIVDLAQQLKTSGKFATCLSSQMMSYAANFVLHSDDCGVQAVGQSLTSGGDKFTDMVRGIALSPTFRTRSITGAM